MKNPLLFCTEICAVCSAGAAGRGGALLRPMGSCKPNQHSVGADDPVGPKNIANLPKILLKTVRSAGGQSRPPLRRRGRCFRIHRKFSKTHCFPPGGTEPRPYRDYSVFALLHEIDVRRLFFQCKFITLFSCIQVAEKPESAWDSGKFLSLSQAARFRSAKDTAKYTASSSAIVAPAEQPSQYAAHSPRRPHKSADRTDSR